MLRIISSEVRNKLLKADGTAQNVSNNAEHAFVNAAKGQETIGSFVEQMNVKIGRAHV